MTQPATEWNIGDLIAAITPLRGATPMIVEPHRELSWADVDQRTSSVAAHLVAAGLGRGDRVGVCARNSAAVLETYLACTKAALVPFNVNFRYGVEELAYLFGNADARAIVADADVLPAVEQAAAQAGGVRCVLAVAGAGDTYEAVASQPFAGSYTPPWGRSPDDLVFQYTGGTTGMPKGVMWRQGDLVTLLAGADAPPGDDRRGATADIAERLAPRPRRSCAVAPLIHGTGLLSQLANLFTGGTSVVLPGLRFDPDEVWHGVDRHGVNVLVIVGDPFARPLLDRLDADRRRFDLSTLQMITSSGAMFSQQVKAGLLGHLPGVAILDAFGSSEASGLGSSMSTSAEVDATASFRPGVRMAILDEAGRVLPPEPGTRGRIAVRAPVPVGYHKDPVKSAETYPVIDGQRYSVPGDIVEIAADGTVLLLGRGSAVINTGGEKVFAEEVEELLKTHPRVADAAVVAIPDDRFGSAVCAVVQIGSAAVVSAAELRDHVRGLAAAFKVPKRVMFVGDLERHPNGKLDRVRWAEHAQRASGA